MKFARAASGSLLASCCFGSPLMSFHTRQAPGSYYPITGPSGGIHPRLEIRQLQQNGEMWNLFLLALEEFQAMKQTEIDSYYQIASIHGMPWYDWDGVPQNPNIKKPVERGYCPHSNILFAIWHRPYMLLFEQKLQAIAITIADRFPDSVKAKYKDAANKLRLPYWDWARTIPANEPVFPAILATEKVQVTNTDNSQSEIDNPLFDFNFNPHNQAEINGTGCRFPPVGGPFDNHFKICNEVTHTVRMAQTADRNVSNHTALERRFKQLHHPIRTTLYHTMSTWQPFDSFANNGRCGDPESGFGIESNHDTIHVEMAPAHMVPVAVSAFDPVFWLHHANVDRFVAIWQAVFPDTYVDQCGAETETWTIANNETLDVNSPLTPFHKNKAGDTWTPANSRNVEELGYTYPEIANKPSNETLVALIKTLYAGPDDGGPAKLKRQEDITLNQAYLTEVQMPKQGTPYSVYVFLGDVSGSADTWLEQDSFVGLASTLGTVSEKPGLGNVDLTDVLEKKIEAGEVTVDRAVEYLKANLKWRLVFAGTEISRSDIAGAKASLISTDVEHSKSQEEFDRWVGGFTNHGEIDV